MRRCLFSDPNYDSSGILLEGHQTEVTAGLVGADPNAQLETAALSDPSARHKNNSRWPSLQPGGPIEAGPDEGDEPVLCLLRLCFEIEVIASPESPFQPSWTADDGREKI